MASTEDNSQSCPSDAPFVKLEEEPAHNIVLENEYVRSYYAVLPPGHTTLLHRHAENTYTVYLCDASVREQLPGGLWSPPRKVSAFAGACKMYHECPIVHRIQASPDNCGPAHILAVEARPTLRKFRSASSSLEAHANPLASVPGYSPLHEGGWDQVLPHKLALAPGESTGMHALPFFGVAMAMTDGALRVDVEEGEAPFEGGATTQRAHIRWFEPPLRQCITNVGDAVFEAIVLQFK